MFKKIKILLITASFIGLTACAPSKGTGDQSLTMAGFIGLQSRAQETSSANLQLQIPQAFTQSNVARIDIEVSGPGIGSLITVPLTNSNGVWSGIVPGIPVGTDRVFTAKAYDASDELLYQGAATSVTIDAFDQAEILILLQGVNQHPALSNIAPLLDSFAMSGNQVLPSGTVSFSVTAHDDDVGDVITYSWVANGGTFDDTASATPVWTAPANNGVYTLSVSVTDTMGAVASMSVDVTVNDGNGSGNVNIGFNNTPALTQINALPTRIDLNETTTLSLVASDADGDPLTFAWSSDCGGSFSDASIQNPVFTAPASYPADNKCLLSVLVDDGRGATNTASITVHVRAPVSVDPIIIPDTQAPTLTALSFSPDSFDTTSGAAVVTINITVADNQSLTASYPGVSLTFTNGSTNIYATPMVSDELPGGTSTLKSYQFTVTFPQSSAGGDWNAGVSLLDNVSNSVYYTSTDILNLGAGFENKVVNTSVVSDTTAPQITALTLSAVSINTETQSQTVTLNISVTDDLGLHAAYSGISLTFANGVTNRYVSLMATDELPGGTSTAKSYQVDVVFPRYLAPGDWNLSASLVDAVGNNRYLTSVDLNNAGYAYRVTNNATFGDTTAPTITSFSMSPGTVNTSSGDQVVTMTIRVQDDYGFGSAYPGISVSFMNNSATIYASAMQVDEQPGGTALDRTYVFTVTFPAGSATGDWLANVSLTDDLSNSSYINSAGLQTGGFDYKITAQ